jgi:hypothetical protein
LIFYNYDPRVKFQYNSDSVAYRIFRRSDNKLLFSVWTDKDYLDTTDQVQNFISDYLNFIKENEDKIKKAGIEKIMWLDKDSLQNLVLLGDSNKIFTIPENSFDFDPILYFADLDSLIGLYGILEIKKYNDITQLVFDSDNSLFYFQDSNLKDNMKMNLKRIDDKWYISNEKINTDYQ